MAPSFDCTVSSLLCAEDNNSIFDDNDCYDATVEELEATWHHGNHQIQNQNSGWWLPMQSEECLVLMVEKECQHLPSGDYLKRLRNGDLGLGARKEAVDWIAKVGSFLFLFIFSLQFDVILDVLKWWFCLIGFSNIWDLVLWKGVLFFSAGV